MSSSYDQLEPAARCILPPPIRRTRRAGNSGAVAVLGSMPPSDGIPSTTTASRGGVPPALVAALLDVVAARVLAQEAAIDVAGAVWIALARSCNAASGDLDVDEHVRLLGIRSLELALDLEGGRARVALARWLVTASGADRAR